MDDGDLDFSNPETYLCPAMDSYFDEILNDTEHHACTHTHTCNPPVYHDHSHTHTCVHVHTKVVASSPDSPSPSENNNNDNNCAASNSKKQQQQRPGGNRAAVRKYREKKKAHTTLLEEEVGRLRALNQQLVKKLQNHAALEAEVARLRCLLVDVRGRIEGEIGAFPYYQRPPLKNVDLVSGGVDQGSLLGAAQVVTNSCDFRCSDQMYCNPGMQGATAHQVLGQAACDVANIQCMGTAKSGSTKLPVCGGMDTMTSSGCLPITENK